MNVTTDPQTLPDLVITLTAREAMIVSAVGGGTLSERDIEAFRTMEATYRRAIEATGGDVPDVEIEQTTFQLFDRLNDYVREWGK